MRINKHSPTPNVDKMMLNDYILHKNYLKKREKSNEVAVFI